MPAQRRIKFTLRFSLLYIHSLVVEIDLDNEIVSEKATALLEKYDQFGIDGILTNFGSKKPEYVMANMQKAEVVNTVPKIKENWFD